MDITWQILSKSQTEEVSFAKFYARIVVITQTQRALGGTYGRIYRKR